MPNYRANHGFDDGRLGRVRRDQSLELNEVAAQPYVRAGLLRSVVTEGDVISAKNPISAAGTLSPASPVAPVSPLPTVKKSGRGRKKKTDGQFSA